VFQSGGRIFRAALAGCLVYGAVFAIVQLLPSIYRAIWAPRVFGLRATAPGVWIVYIVCVLLTLMLFAAATLRQAAVAAGRTSSSGAELSEALRKLLPLTLLTVIAGILAVALGELIIPWMQSTSMPLRIAADLVALAGIYWAVAVLFAWPAVLLLKLRPFDAVVHSVRLVRSHWWSSFLFWFAALVLLLVCLAAAAVPAFLWPFAASGELVGATALAVVAAIVINAIGLPLISALILARFGDLEVRESSMRSTEGAHAMTDGPRAISDPTA
jgi:hypothetical protein